MGGVLAGFVDIGIVIALGFGLAHWRLVDTAAQETLAALAFFVAVPALMLTTVSRADISELFSIGLLALALGIVVPGLVYVALAVAVWQRSAGETVIGFMSSTYVNAGNLGVPIASYALGSAAFIAPMLLFQMIVVQPICLAILDADVTGRFSVRRMAMRPFKNPLTVAALTATAMAAMHWSIPTLVAGPVELVGAMAVPSMLIAYGIALRLGPGLGSDGPQVELAVVTLLKLVAQPAVTWFVAAVVLGIDGHALLVLVIASALPTAQNIFVHAVRHDRATVLARDAILLTTLGAAPIILGIAAVLG